ncbi:hypothetical protein Goshw_014757 [Gossypium schwendimanii]|uniref:Reverse transcriptase zinc-binding domain-containing protein n=1 Tax=Gossypium schwendimanii TaxID=34291 RepID=A0A7J9N045_GOSSC|nr:hypothetical protein [Gossypium schwendimanii]
MPSKIAFTIWRISWDFIPNFANLRIRRVVTNDRCPRCRSEVEGSLHVFQDCPMTTEVWHYESYGVQEDILRVRIHFDAAYDNKTFRSVSSMVGWDLRGNLTVVKMVIHRNVLSPFPAKAYACLDGTKLGISLRTQSVKLMGDSRTVKRKCQETSTDKSTIRAIIRDIQNKKSDFQEFIFQYIQRSENSYAHRLAKNTLEKGETTYLMGEELDHHAFASVGIWSKNPD